jgi:hypothetical protein
VIAAALAAPPGAAPRASAADTERLPEGLSVYAEDTLRWEHWSFFDPAPPGGDPDYDFGGSRLRAGVRYERPRFALHAAVQYVQLFGVPNDAIGTPGGVLGTGGSYYETSSERAPEAVQLKYLSAEARDLFDAGLDVALGRFTYSSGLGPDTGIPKLEAVKRARIAERLIGEFGFSFFQRSFDGARVRWHPGPAELDLAVFHPTEGGYEDGGTRWIDDIGVAAAAFTLAPGVLLPGAELQAFYYAYGDDRAVRARVDNTGLPAPDRQDIEIHTGGCHLAGAWPLGPGEADLVAWGAYQGGHWYEQDHRAAAGALEAGYQLTGVAWKPWLRVGFFRSTGDGDPDDGTHGTFFQLLPTSRGYALTTAYNLMNSTDAFAELRLQPAPELSIQLDVHDLRLSSSEDRWYAGSGATQRKGTIFGYSGKSSGGDHHLGTAAQLSVGYRANEILAGRAFYGHLFGGDVVRANFADSDALDYFFLELTVALEWKGRPTAARPPP